MSNRTSVNALCYEHVREEFEDIGETLADDLFAVCVTLVRDVHFDDYELSVRVYGKGGKGEAPVVEKSLSLSQAGLDLERLRTRQPVDPLVVLNLFDAPLRSLLVRKRIYIEWNPDEPTEVTIDLVKLLGTTPLKAMDR